MNVTLISIGQKLGSPRAGLNVVTEGKESLPGIKPSLPACSQSRYSYSYSLCD
jgi:hypothetical protein